MRILIVLGALELGGAERQALLLVEYLRGRRGHEVSIVGFGSTGRIMDICTEKGIACHGCPDPPYIDGYGDKKRYKRCLSFAIQLRQYKPDCIISFTSIANIASAMIWRLSGAKVHIWSQRCGDFENFYLEACPEALKKPTVFVANAPVGERVLTSFGVTPRSIHVICNGAVLPENGKPPDVWREELGFEADALVGCMLANIHPPKDHKTLLLAWANTVRAGSFPRNARLLIAGRHDNAADLRQLAVDLKLQDSVLFLEEVHDVAGLLHMADIGIFCSYSEGFPNAVLEGMLAGLPFVASDIPGIRAVVGEDSGNLLTPPGDVDALSRALERMFTDKALCRKLGQSNKKRAEQFTPERMGSNFANLIENSFEQAGNISFVSLFRDAAMLWDTEDVIQYAKKILQKVLGKIGMPK